jgi:long-chain acyl-CoA synthetase
MSADTVPARLFARAADKPARPAYYEKRDGIWVPTAYRAYSLQVKRVGKALMALGCEPGSCVSILGFNRPEWVIFDLASMCIGGAPAGIYTTCSPSEVGYIIRHSRSPVVLVENETQYRKVAAEAPSLPDLRWIVTMRGANVDAPSVIPWEKLEERGEGITDEAFFARLHALKPDGLATLIYTSGTTGPPKGVMLSHENLAWTSKTADQITGRGPVADVSLSYLPLSHIAEQMFSIHAPITTGAAIYFAESIEKVPDNLKEVRPTIFFGVPRIWEKLHAGISGKLAEAKGAKAKIAAWAMAVGKQVSAHRMKGRPLPPALAAQHRAADKLFFSKVKAAIGLDRARLCVSGAAPVAKEVLELFTGLDLVVQEVYGQSEDTGPTSYNVAGRTKLGTVGPAIPGIQVKIADDGEILVKGPNVFLGYYREPEATQEVLVDGWLHSGDLGAFDADGFLSITGRKKEIIITAGGKNVAPKNIEAALKNHVLVGEAVVIGDRRKYLTALVTLDPEAVTKFKRDHGIGDDVPIHLHKAVIAEVQRALDGVNAELARVEQVKKFLVLPRPFGIDTGELTPTLKVKRKVVSEKYGAEIESMYREDATAGQS